MLNFIKSPSFQSIYCVSLQGIVEHAVLTTFVYDATLVTEILHCSVSCTEVNRIHSGIIYRMVAIETMLKHISIALLSNSVRLCYVCKLVLLWFHIVTGDVFMFLWLRTDVSYTQYLRNICRLLCYPGYQTLEN